MLKGVDFISDKMAVHICVDAVGVSLWCCIHWKMKTWWTWYWSALPPDRVVDLSCVAESLNRGDWLLVKYSSMCKDRIAVCPHGGGTHSLWSSSLILNLNLKLSRAASPVQRQELVEVGRCPLRMPIGRQTGKYTHDLLEGTLFSWPGCFLGF